MLSATDHPQTVSTLTRERSGGAATSPTECHRPSRLRRFCGWYFSCLCLSSHETEAGGQRGNDHHNDSLTDHSATQKSSYSLLMRILMRESWTDGSLIALKTDVLAGLTLAVAQVAPSVAFALMGHGQPLVGLYSSFFLGVISCVFGGRPGQITAIAGAVVVLYPNLVDKHGYGAASAVSVIAGGFLLLPGIFRFARLVRLLPASLMLGFCNGLALSMVVNQIQQFRRVDGNFVTGLQAIYTAVICVVTYSVMMLMPYFTTVVPSAFVAVVVGTAIEYIFKMGTVTIGDLYQLHGSFPKPMIPDVNWADTEAIKDVMVASVLTAIISSVESFMSGYKIQQLTETPTSFERESLALGAAHILNGFFQGMSGCVVFGPCILNIEIGGGTRRVSSFICALLMVVIPLALYRAIGIVPMGALSAVVFGVSSKTADWRMLAMIFLQRISFQESVVAIVVTVVTVISDLAIGAASGLAAALVFFMWNMARGRVRLSPMESVCPTRRVSGLRQQSQEPEELQQTPPRLSARLTQSSETWAVSTPEASHCCFSADPPAAKNQRSNADSSGTRLVRPEILPPVLPGSLMGRPHELDVNFLDIVRDERFPEVRVLRIKLHGVLFFGSCMEFVDCMLKMLRVHHGQIFLKVTDFILDFQHGRMPVLDFSAAEAIQDTARILAKRGIRTHVKNMDPLSWACFDRVRRYFPDVCDDDVNNVKHVCYVRRIFNIMPRRETHTARGRTDGLDDDVFLRSSRTLGHTTTVTSFSMGEPVRKDAGTPSVAPTSGGDNYLSHAQENDNHHVCQGVRDSSPGLGEGTNPAIVVSSEPITLSNHEEQEIASAEQQLGISESETPVVHLSSMEELLPFVESIKVGFPVYLQSLDLTVPVFDTVSHWVQRTADDIAAGRTPVLEVGLTSAEPLDRQFGDVGGLWWRRLWNLDIPAWVFQGGSPVPDTPRVTTARSPSVPLCRPAPKVFEQIPRFPGQGYAKGEKLSRWEWAAIQSSVCRRLFATEPPSQRCCFVEQMMRAEKELVDGFI